MLNKKDYEQLLLIIEKDTYEQENQLMYLGNRIEDKADRKEIKKILKCNEELTKKLQEEVK